MSKSQSNTRKKQDNEHNEQWRDYSVKCLLSLPAQIRDIHRILRKYPRSFKLDEFIELVFQAAMDDEEALDPVYIYDYIYENCGYKVEESDFDIENPEVDALIKIAEEIYHLHAVFLHELVEDEEFNSRSIRTYADFRLLRNLNHVEATIDFRTSAG